MSQLRNIQSGKAGCYGDLVVDAVYAYDIDSTPEELDRYCKDCDFVFNLAGVNRPQKQEEFMQGNFGFASTLLDTLKKHHNNCPVMIPVRYRQPWPAVLVLLSMERVRRRERN